MTIPVTKREPGPLNREELKGFQRQFGLKVDGKFGRQSMGQVIRLFNAYEDLNVDYIALKAAYQSKPADEAPEIAQKKLNAIFAWVSTGAAAAAAGAAAAFAWADHLRSIF